MGHKTTDKERQESIDHLLTLLKPGDTVRTILRHVARSGMQREISLCIGIHDTDVDHNSGETIRRIRIYKLDHYVASALDLRLGRHDGLVIGGCGMDMGFELVYLLGKKLWPNGTERPHGRRNGQEWL